ncbi:hypothetical protein A2392_00710 [Candidatus Kaiserbacteria bacterium RIFOXYB1_FULL_46_14]|uniref:Peptidase C39-like domain-containing protein n=1 Tax=Candidatus Kaiserbacteria bacterium RIFOXYB1_FULL_46_14 TaxID=1798531 RepID=A0A1F6FJ92_9BACT|nr:MAG: hypothetical protein A2392_00710 [Candidatus Kaiserbacteria bacterium RIFOXYB1_FULL_46_14]
MTGLSRFISIVAFFTISSWPAHAGEWWNHPLAGETSQMSIPGTEFTPPDWLRPCPLLADASGDNLVGQCMEVQATSQKTDRSALSIPYNVLLLQHMERINREVNSSEGDMLKAALEKRRLLIESGWPRSALLLAYCETDREDNVTEHVVLVARFKRGDVVFDGKMLEMLPWQFSPHRFYGIESPLEPTKWLAVEDIRDDPIERSIEWSCSIEHC